MKTDYILTKEDIDKEIEENGYIVISAGGTSGRRRYNFLLSKPLYNDHDFGYYFYGVCCSSMETLRRYKDEPRTPNCDVAFPQLLNCFRDMRIERITLFDLVET